MLRIRAAAAAVAVIAGLALVSLSLLASQNAPAAGAGGTAQVLTAADVAAVINVAASALNNRTLAVAVVDRTGAIVGAYTRPDAGSLAPDVAVTLARAGAMFANDQAPLSSRTVRFISGVHFPPGVRNTANAALYGVEKEGFHPPDSLRVDNSIITDERGSAIRLPYLKLPRNPELQR